MKYSILAVSAIAALWVLLGDTAKAPALAPENVDAKVTSSPWQTLVRRHYLAYAANSMEPLQLGVDWVGAIVFVGRYRGTFEPCGCAFGQKGGHEWELPALRAIEGQVGRTVVVSIGMDIEEEGSPVAAYIGQTYRELNAAYLMECFAAAGIDHWTPSEGDCAYAANIPSSLDVSWPGSGRMVRFQQDARSLNVRIESPGGDHVGAPGDRTDSAADFRVIVFHGDRGHENKRSAPPTQVARALTIDVAGTLPRSTARRVRRWGQGLGTTLAVLRFGVIGATRGSDLAGIESNQPVDLQALRGILALGRAGASLDAIRM